MDPKKIATSAVERLSKDNYSGLSVINVKICKAMIKPSL